MLQSDLNGRYRSVDFVKGICIVFILITHYMWSDSERLKLLFPFYIDMAVPIFMIISGYVHAKSFTKKNIATIGEAYTLKNTIGKIIRYTVPFVLAFVFEEVAYSAIGVVSHKPFQMLLIFLGGGFGPGSYYFPIMIQFVFWFPIIFFIIKKYDFTGLIICGAINVTYEILKLAYGMNEGCYRVLIFRYTLLIAYGIYLTKGNSRRKRISIICEVIGITYIVLVNYFGIKPVITEFWSGTSVIACLYIIPISSFLIFNKAHSRLVEFIGKASYDIYLVQMVYYVGAGAMYKVVGNRVLQLLINILVCLVAGMVFYIIESSITKALNTKVSKYLKTS